MIHELLMKKRSSKCHRLKKYIYFLLQILQTDKNIFEKNVGEFLVGILYHRFS